MSEVKVRWFLRGLPVPPLGWALALDALDVIVAPTQALPLIGEGPKILMNIVQGLLSVIIFENPLMWFFGVFLDAVSPSPIDTLMPSYTLGYIAVANGYDVISLSRAVKRFILFGLLIVLLIILVMAIGGITIAGMTLK